MPLSPTPPCIVSLQAITYGVQASGLCLYEGVLAGASAAVAFADKVSTACRSLRLPLLLPPPCLARLFFSSTSTSRGSLHLLPSHPPLQVDLTHYDGLVGYKGSNFTAVLQSTAKLAKLQASYFQDVSADVKVGVTRALQQLG